MQIFVDADACPVVGIVEKVAKEHELPVTLLCDTNHVLSSDYSEVIVVGAGADAVDYKLISICHKGDIVVSQDYGDPKKRTSEDDEHFSESFEKMIRMAIQNREGENNGKPVISPIVNG